MKEREFITAVTTAGGSGLWIMRKHLLPNVLPSVFVLAAFDVGVIITIESSLSFIGLGIQPPTPSLGLMIAEAQRYMQSNLSLTLFPALTIFLLIGGIQFASQSLMSGKSRGR
jgi:peptide/nickel transport system permease protein